MSTIYEQPYGWNLPTYYGPEMPMRTLNKGDVIQYDNNTENIEVETND